MLTVELPERVPPPSAVTRPISRTGTTLPKKSTPDPAMR
jgi:hypothetical protein